MSIVKATKNPFSSSIFHMPVEMMMTKKCDTNNAYEELLEDSIIFEIRLVIT